MHKIPISGLPFIVSFALLIATPSGLADVAPEAILAPCASPLPASGQSPQRFDAVGLMMVAKELEAQGEANFHLRYKPPAGECLVESFSVGDAAIRATYSPFEKGPSTLEYRFAVRRTDGNSEVLVIYDGMASLFAGGGYIFHVSEERNGVISWYAIFREEPTYAATKSLVQRIVGGEERPLMAVRWPPGAKEGEVVAYDSKRLKR